MTTRVALVTGGSSGIGEQTARRLRKAGFEVYAVARRVGLSSATNLRRRFLDALGTTPGAYRRLFRSR